ncbi:reprolysin-like metallopeptidase [Arenimonas sp.]|uniref:reprolysin-like metallopeptidase n=1 Tax=Arenimonas sp. TaxID=1872635 RepID=UPI0025C26F10|nr:M12 family metallo-peptidase [Arenimonas sp.]
MRLAVFSCVALAVALALAPTSLPHAADGKGAVRLFKLDERVEHEGLLRFRPLEIDTKALAFAAASRGSIAVPDPDGGELVYDYVSHTEHANGITTWVGRREGDLAGFEAVFTVGGGAVFGQAPRADGSLLYVETVGGELRLMEDLAVDIGQRSAVQVDDEVIPDASDLVAAQKALAAARPAPSTQSEAHRIDILLAYTPGLASYVGSDLATRTLLQNRIDLGNTALANAGVVGRFRLVATPRVDYPDTGSNSDTLALMRAWNGAGAHPLAMQLATLRYRHGADLVGLVRRYLNSDSGSCGVGYVNGGGNNPGSIPFQQNSGYFNANHGTDNGFFCLSTTIAHEIGHNLGQTHDIDTTGGARNAAHSYAHGYRITPEGQNGFSTVMAYGTGSQRSANIFSNPLVSHTECSNLPCGTAQADVARSLAETMPLVAAWFQPADGDARQINSSRGHMDVTFSGLPALTDARWRVNYAGAGSFTLTGPTRAAAGATISARLSWSGLQAPFNSAFPVQLVVESSPAVVASTRNLQLTLRDYMPSPITLGDNRPVSLASARWSVSRDYHETRMQFVLPPHANTARVRMVSNADIDLYATPAGPRAIATSALIGPGLERGATQVSDTGTATTKEIVITRTAGAVGAERWMIGLGRPSSASLVYNEATVTARVETQSTAPAFQSGQYYNPQRPGHGVFVDFAGDQWVAVWYTYREDGTPTWYYSQAAAPGASGIWNAPLFRVGWNGSQTTSTVVGDLVVTPVSTNEMEFSYNLDGEAGSEPMFRLGGGSGCPVSAAAPLDATGHWYSPTLAGFGYSAQYEPTQEIYISYLYDAEGVARWLIGAKPWNEGVTNVPMEQLTGFCPTCGHMPTISRPTGTLTRTIGANADGKRGLTQVGVNAPLLSPLTGSWNESRGTALLSARKNCL